MISSIATELNLTKAALNHAASNVTDSVQVSVYSVFTCSASV